MRGDPDTVRDERAAVGRHQGEAAVYDNLVASRPWHAGRMGVAAITARRHSH